MKDDLAQNCQVFNRWMICVKLEMFVSSVCIFCITLVRTLWEPYQVLHNVMCGYTCTSKGSHPVYEGN